MPCVNTETFLKQPTEFNVASRQMISAINIRGEFFYCIPAVCDHNHNGDKLKYDDARGCGVLAVCQLCGGVTSRTFGIPPPCGFL